MTSAPKGWIKTLSAIQTMRSSLTAPVDTHGAHATASTTNLTSDCFIFELETLLFLMLSSQTKDGVTHSAVIKMREAGLTKHPTSIFCSSTARVEASDLEEWSRRFLYPVGFWRQKGKYVWLSRDIIMRRFMERQSTENKALIESFSCPCQCLKSCLLTSYSDLVELPGVGPKMTHLYLQIVFPERQSEGIAVDTHVHRVANRLHWVSSSKSKEKWKETKSPEETMRQLEEWLPRRLWAEINPLLVGFGQMICLPQRPKCGECLLRHTCPSSTAK